MDQADLAGVALAQSLDFRSTPEKPRMAVSGVRSSCVMLARKSVLAAAAASERAKASINSPSSAFLLVMSRETPSSRPLPSLSREKVVSAQIAEPSLVKT